MLTNKPLYLTSSILGIHTLCDTRTGIMIPEGSTVEVVQSETADSRMVDVLWGDRTITVFAEDLEQRSQQVRSVRKGHSASSPSSG